ncbi:unnamed protein product, partial [Iphiclides podalirius]
MGVADRAHAKLKRQHNYRDALASRRPQNREPKTEAAAAARTDLCTLSGGDATTRLIVDGARSCDVTMHRSIDCAAHATCYGKTRAPLEPVHTTRCVDEALSQRRFTYHVHTADCSHRDEKSRSRAKAAPFPAELGRGARTLPVSPLVSNFALRQRPSLYNKPLRIHAGRHRAMSRISLAAHSAAIAIKRRRESKAAIPRLYLAMLYAGAGASALAITNFHHRYHYDGWGTREAICHAFLAQPVNAAPHGRTDAVPRPGGRCDNGARIARCPGGKKSATPRGLAAARTGWTGAAKSGVVTGGGGSAPPAGLRPRSAFAPSPARRAARTPRRRVA